MTQIHEIEIKARQQVIGVPGSLPASRLAFLKHNAMTDELAKQYMRSVFPNFDTISIFLQQAAVAGFVAGYNKGHEDGMAQAAKVVKTVNDHLNPCVCGGR